MSQALFITLEGIEGSGKSTAVRLIQEWLAMRKIPARVTREPGGTVLAESIRRLVLERGTETVAPPAETLLMFAARRIHLDNLIRPALARGQWVVCDRFTDATRAYQGYGRGMDLGWIEQLASVVHADLQPHCTLLLDVPVEVGLARARNRPGAAMDRFEAEQAEFFERVRQGYLSLARQEPQRIRLIDAAADLPAVTSQIVAVLSGLIQHAGGRSMLST
ncbi:MAG TPA: dTMP kinase [Steroidobacteraceae bacterium]